MRLFSRRSQRYVLAMVAGFAFCIPALAEGPGWSGNSVVKKLVVTADGGRTGTEITADYCVCTIPPMVLSRIVREPGIISRPP